MKRLALGVLLVAGCAEQAKPFYCTASGETKASVVTFATFAKQLPDKTVEGLDIDGIVSDGTDEAGCYKKDFIGTDGTPGVDNQVATLLPIVEGAVGKGNIDAILGAAISNGQLIIMMAVRGVDDPHSDDCVDVAFGAGMGSPYLDGSGKYLSNQTFAWDLALDPVSVLRGGRIDGGVLTAGPGDIIIPVRILDAKFNLSLHSARVKMKLTADPLFGGATLSGLVGGGVEVEELGTIIKSLNIGQSVMGAVVPLLKSNADLAPRGDGTCHQISAALRFDTTAAFLMGE